jgi:poly(A) polymerase
MIKKFIDKLLGRSDAADKPTLGKRLVIAASVHGIDPQLVDERAVQVVKTLQERGYSAYIVGGAVRDLLMGLSPKDFDVATDATPEEVKSLFRRAFIIGRRFRIVHVVFGRGREHEVIEVSTFRAYLDSADAQQVKGNERSSKSELAGMKHAVDASGRVLRDNVWGPQDEDAARRDFTINAMYYDPLTGDVIDYHGGMKDAKKKLLRMIGDPAARYREDPVRIIRAVRFSAKLSALGFKIETHTSQALGGLAGRGAAKPPVRRDAQVAANGACPGQRGPTQCSGFAKGNLSFAGCRGRACR